MANTPISGFPSGAPAQSGDQVVIARAGANYSLLNSDLKALIVGAGSVSVASGKTFTASNTLTLAGTDGSTLNVGTGGTLGALATVSAGTGVATAAGNAVNGSGGFITYSTFAPTSGKTLTLNNSLTLAGTDGTTMTFPSASGTVATLNAANLFTKANTFQPDSDAQAGTFRRNSSGQTANVVEIQTEANAFLAAFDKTGALTIGAASGNTGALKLAGTTSGTVTLSTADAAGTWTMKLPTSGGTNNYLLATDGSGNTSWVAPPSTTLTVGSTATSGGAAGQLMFDTGSVLSESSSLVWDNTNKLLTVTGLGTGGGANTGGLTVSGGSLTLSGNISANAWTTSGIRYKSVAATLTDLTSTGTVATAYTNVYGGNTIAASNATTFTDYFTTFITQPTAGSNVTLTNRWALGLSGNLKISGGTVTASAPVLDLSQTWNGSGQVFRGISLNVTDTLSSLVSGLIDLQFGGSTYFRVGKGGSGYAYAWLSPGITPSTTNYFLARGSAATYFNTPTGTFHSFIYNDGNARATFFTDRAALANNMSFGWSSTTTGSDTLDLILNRAAAATLQLGAADAASPVAQTLQVQNVVAGTSNTAGANFTINGSRGTGTGAGGSIIFQVAPAGTSGTSQNALATALTIDSTRLATFAGNITGSSNFTITSGSVLYLVSTGSNRISFYTNSSERWSISGSGLFSPNTSNSLDIGSSSALVRSLYIGTSVVISAANIVTDTATGTKIGTATNQKLGFFNATPVVQPSGTGNTTTSAAGSTNAVYTDTTFTGGTGTASYTVGDIIKALKDLGMLAA